MFTQVNQNQIINYLNKNDVKQWVLQHCKSLENYQQFCKDFADKVCGDGMGFRKSFESQFYIHNDNKSEYHFYLNVNHNYLEITTYPKFGGRNTSVKCPIAFKNNLGQQIPSIPKSYQHGV